MNAFSNSGPRGADALLLVGALLGMVWTVAAAPRSPLPRRTGAASRRTSQSASIGSHGKIVYSDGRNLRVMGADGRGDRVLVKSVSLPLVSGAAHFSPDLKKIVYITVRAHAEPHEGTEIWTMRSNGSGR